MFLEIQKLSYTFINIYNRMDQEPIISFIPQVTKKSENPFPWITQRTKNHPNSLLRFHNEIIQFAQYVSPIPGQHLSKKNSVTKLEKKMKSIFPQSTLMNPLFTNRFYLKGTQIQLFLIIPNLKAEHAQTVISELSDYKQIRQYQYLDQRKVEDYKIICQDPENQNQIWITLVDESWRPFLQDCQEIIANSPQIKYLTFINLCMVRQRGFHHMIKSILVFAICAYFIYERRKQRVRTLTEHFIKFLQFFGGGTASQKKIIYKGKNTFDAFLIQQQKLFCFEIAQGVDLSVNLVKDYFKLLQNRYRVMGNYSYEPGTSIVSHLVNPIQSEFTYL